MEYREIKEKRVDMAGKHRVKVQVSDNDVVELKFQTDPTEEQVIAVTQTRISFEEAELARIEAERIAQEEELAKAELIKNISLAELQALLESQNESGQ